jgi:tetratricopeptide (TPR) repeat protein
MMMMMAASLLIGAAPYGRTDPIPEETNKARLESARTAEQNGDLARAHNENALAISFYQTALRVDRQNAVLYNKLGIAELQLGRRGQARKHFAQAVKFDPRLVSALNNLGAVALLDKRYSPAISYFKQALALDESVASTHLNIAEAWMGLGQIDHAMTEYARALELDADILTDSQGGSIAQVSTPEQRARISFLIAKSYVRRGNLDGALEFLGRAKEGHYPDLAKVYSDPDFAPLWKDPRLAKIVKR